MKLLTAVACVLVLVVSAQAASVTPPECQWGASYWCQSSDTAQRCGQLSYCQNNVWMKAPEGLECELCELVVKAVENEFETNKTKEVCKADLEKLCSDIGPLAGECKNLVEEYFDQIWNFITQETDAKTVCTLIKLCSSTKTTAKKVGDGIECTLCKALVETADKYLTTNKTETEAKNAVEEACGDLGPLKSVCDTLVDSYFDQIWQMLVNAVSPDAVCSEIGLCSSSALKLNVHAAPKEPVDCQMCEVVLTVIEEAIFNDKTEDDVKHLVEKVCPYFGGLASECSSFLDANFDAIWHLVVTEVKPSLICKLIFSNCNTVRSRLVKKPKDLCDSCKAAVNFIKPFVDSNSTETEVKAAVEAFCSLLPSDTKDECNSLVNNYFDIFWTLLKSEVDSGDICKQIGLCNSTNFITTLQQLPRPVKAPKDMCGTCKMAVNFIKPFVDSNSTENEVKEAVQKICNLLPGSYGDECNELVKDYFDMVWSLLKAEVDSGDVCNMIGLCNSPSRLQKRQQHSAKPTQSLCDLCELAVSFLKPYVDSNSTENEVKQALEQVCDILPAAYKDECNTLVNDYFDVVWSLVKSEFDNDLICKQIGLCNSTQTQVLAKAPSLVRKVKVEVQGGVLCTLCEFVMKELASMIANNATEAAINTALEKVCNLLPSTISDECDDFVEKYATEIIKLLLEGEAPRAVCTLMTLCLVEDTQLRGDSECDMCVLAITFLKSTLASNATQEEVGKALTALCKLMPAPIGDECSTIVQDYLPDIVQLIDEVIANDVDPKELCQKLGLCTSTNVEAPLKLLRIN